MLATTQTSCVSLDALARDGRVVHIRALRRDDLPALQTMYEQASDDSLRLRFFALDRDEARRYASQLLTEGTHHYTLGAFAGTRLLGVGEYTPIDPDTADFALQIADDAQHAGIGTLLLEHLVAAARERGIRRFSGEVLTANLSMLDVLRNLGPVNTTVTEYGQSHIEFDLDPVDPIIAALTRREESAAVASMRALLAPRSLVVVGAGHRTGSVGHEVLRNIIDAGFTGQTYAVNPHRTSVLGIGCYHDPRELPEAPDLAIIALPADAACAAVQACGERGTRAAVLLGSGFSESGPAGADLQDHVLAIARRYGMRLLGPNCLGLLNTDPAIRLDATFAVLSRRPGTIGLLAQSGAFGAALLDAADRVGLGVAQFVSIGNKIDIGGNDLLLAWDADPRVRVIAGYLESVGDARSFARIGRQVSRRKPILVVKSGRTPAGQAAGRSHTAAAAGSDIAVDALFSAAGVLRVATMAELLDAARLLSDEPLPAGPRVAIVGNSGGPEILAADAATRVGLSVGDPDAETAKALCDIGVPPRNPIDLGAAVDPPTLAAVLRTLTTSASIDAIIVVLTLVATTDPAELEGTIAAAAAASDKPLISVSAGRPGASRELPGLAKRLTVFTFPEQAASALGIAHRYAQQRARVTIAPVRPADVDVDGARTTIEAALHNGVEWLEPADAFGLLRRYGIPAAQSLIVSDPETAVVSAAAAELCYPLAAKLAAPGLHKSELGGVRLGIADADELRAAVTDLSSLGDGRVLLQSMISGGTELIVGTVHDPQCGQLVMVGAGGTFTDILDDRAFGLAPIGGDDADDLLAGLRCARLLDGYRGASPVDRTAVRDVLVRLGTLADDLPEVAELDINPLIARSDGLHAVDVRIRVAQPPHRPSPLVRRLRGPRMDVAGQDRPNGVVPAAVPLT